jgi:hypothetical protein
MYKLIKDILADKVDGVKRLEDGACIPFDPDNTDYQAFLLWKSEGNEPLPAENE